jgi:hypothetical protein
MIPYSISITIPISNSAMQRSSSPELLVVAIRGVKATCTHVVPARGFKIDVNHGTAFGVTDGSMIAFHFAEQV